MEQLVLDHHDEVVFPLDLSLVHRTQQKEINKRRNSKLKQLLNKMDSKYNITTIENVEVQ